jgi:hypothetical protein
LILTMVTASYNRFYKIANLLRTNFFGICAGFLIQEFCLAGSYEVTNFPPKFLDLLKVRKGAIRSMIVEDSC